MRTSLLHRVVRGAVLAVPLLAALAGSARAQPREREYDRERGSERQFGFGSAFGGGFVGAGVLGFSGSSNSGVYGYPMLPTFEMKFFFQPHDFSIDVTIPITNIAVASAAAHAFFFETDAMFDFNIGRGSVRGILGPGFGLDVLIVGDSGVSSAVGIRVPAQIGMEVLAARNHFGFNVLARPWFEVVPAGGAAVLGGGALFEIGFMGYITRR